MTVRSLLLAITLYFSFFAITSTHAACEDRWCDEAKTQLIAGAMVLNEGNYELVEEPVVGKIYRGQKTVTVPAKLIADKSYAIFAVCDSDCADIDLRVYDDNGNLVAEDTEKDDTPIVEIFPKWTAYFEIRVSVPSCSANRCTYGVGIFAEKADGSSENNQDSADSGVGSDADSDEEACDFMYQIYKKCYTEGINESAQTCAQLSTDIMTSDSLDLPEDIATALGLLCGMGCTDASNDEGLPSYSRFRDSNCGD